MNVRWSTGPSLGSNYENCDNEPSFLIEVWTTLCEQLILTIVAALSHPVSWNESPAFSYWTPFWGVLRSVMTSEWVTLAGNTDAVRDHNCIVNLKGYQFVRHPENWRFVVKVTQFTPLEWKACNRNLTSVIFIQVWGFLQDFCQLRGLQMGVVYSAYNSSQG